MAITQDVFVINEGFSERRRTTSRGTKSRYTLDVKADPVLINLSEVALGKGPAEAIRDAISSGIKAISQVASPGTLLRRKYAETAFQRGEPHTVRRYSGGRTGAKAPNRSDRYGNDSGRLAEGLHVMQNQKEGAWTVNVPANRFDPSTFKSMADFTRMVDRLRELVPVIRNPLSAPEVRAAISASLDNMIQVATDKNYKQKIALMKAGIQVIRNLANIFSGGA